MENNSHHQPNGESILNQDQCLERILNSIQKSKPGSYIRKGDGENIILGYRTLNQISFLKYRKKLIHFNIRIWDIKFQKFLIRELTLACKSASILGISPLKHRHGFWSLEEDILKQLSISNLQFGDVNFHMGFIKLPFQKKLLNPIAEEIITNRKIGIISHFKVEGFFG